jgi:hypothetical protein
MSAPARLRPGELGVQDVQVDIGQQRGDDPALRGPGDRPLEPLLGHYSCLQPQANQLEHPPVAHPPAHCGEKAIMIDLAEEVADVELGRELAALDEAHPEALHRLRGRPLRPEPVRARAEVRLEDGLQHDPGGLLGYPVADRGDAQRPLPALWFRDVYAPGRRGTIHTCAQVSLELTQQPGDPVLFLHVRQGDPIHPGAAPVHTHPAPRLPQDVTPADTVIQDVEPPPLRLLGRSP